MPDESGSQPRDVRMRGFAHRTALEVAHQWVTANSHALDSESIPFHDAFGRILATDVIAREDVPAFDRSAMDGYAVHAEETQGAGDYNPITLQIIGEARPGHSFEQPVPPQSAVRIMTGAPIPPGADAVIPAEYAQATAETVEITTTVPPSRHIGRRGEDVAAGDSLLPAGRRLRPQDIALIASIGVSRIDVVRQPRVRLLTTGNELVQPGQPRGPHQIFDSNTSMLHCLVSRDGGVLESHRHLPDERDEIKRALTESGTDVILVSGGSSVGAEDHAPMLVAELGELSIHGIAMRPSSPAGMGRIGNTLVFLLPGNPVSCLCAYDFFVGMCIRLLGGRVAEWPYRKRRGELTRKISSAVGRVDYCRVEFEENGVRPLAISGASILSSTTRADGFVIVPAASEGFAPGTAVDVWMYDPDR